MTGAQCFNLSDDELLVIGGIDAQKKIHRTILKLNKKEFAGLEKVRDLKYDRVFSFCIRVGDKMFVIGGNKERELEAYKLSDLSEVDDIDELEKTVFFQLENYITDFTLSQCSYA